MTPLLIGALLLSGANILKSAKEQSQYNDLISNNQNDLNQILEKKRLTYLKSGLKIKGSALMDLQNMRSKGERNIDKIREEKSDFLIKSILGIPMNTYKYLGSDYLKKDLFSKKSFLKDGGF